MALKIKFNIGTDLNGCTVIIFNISSVWSANTYTFLDSKTSGEVLFFNQHVGLLSSTAD